jgi:hypothetical protein
MTASRGDVALPPKADIERCPRNVRFVPIADMIYHSITSSARTSMLGGIGIPSAALRDIIAGSREGLAMPDRYEKLSRLSDWELARRGPTRADTGRLAVNGGR